MPKMNKKMAKQVDEAEESAGFTPLEPGIYLAQLKDVTVSENPGPSGAHYWTWEFEIPAGEDNAGKRFWNTTSLSEKALGMPGGIKQTFAAFGVSADTDTDELVGEYVNLLVGQEVQQKGKNAGKMQNVVEEVLPAEYDEGGDEEEPF